jgi:putative hydrolase
MSDPGSPGDDPFQGMPFLGDLARLINQQGPVAWDAATQLALSIATEGQPEPNVDPLERIRIEQLARLAEVQVNGVTGLTTAIGGRVVRVEPVTRSMWAQRALTSLRPLFERVAQAVAQPLDTPGDSLESLEEGQPDFMGGLLRMMSPMLLGMTAGSMVGHLARRSFGWHDLPIPRADNGELVLVPATIDAFGTDWSLDPDDLRLWVCLNELTHHAVLGLPHVHQALEDLVTSFASGFQPDPDALERRLADMEVGGVESMQGFQQFLSDPEVLLGASRSPAQEALLPRIDALVVVIEGYVDAVMDRIGGRLIGSYGMVTEAMRRHRVESADADRFLERLFGLELTQERYDRGNAFIAGVVERAGFESLERLWESADTLPTPAEIEAPGLWLARIDL